MPFISLLHAFLIVNTKSSWSASFSNLTVKSTTETSAVGTLKAIPVNLPSSSGITFPTAFAAPVEAGIIL